MRKGNQLKGRELLVLKQFKNDAAACTSEDSMLICNVAVYEKLMEAGGRSLRFWLERKGFEELPFDRCPYYKARDKLKVSEAVGEDGGIITEVGCGLLQMWYCGEGRVYRANTRVEGMEEAVMNGGYRVRLVGYPEERKPLAFCVPLGCRLEDVKSSPRDAFYGVTEGIQPM